MLKGLDVFVQLVIAAMTMAPSVSSNAAPSTGTFRSETGLPLSFS